MTKSVGIMWQKVDASIAFCEFLEKLSHFHLSSALKNQLLFVTVFKLLPSLIYFLFIEYFKLIKYPGNENSKLIKIS